MAGTSTREIDQGRSERAIERAEPTEFSDQRRAQLERLSTCWAPSIDDENALPRLRAAPPKGASASRPWRRVKSLRLSLDALPTLQVWRRVELHDNTVMDLWASPCGDIASVDYDGRWCVWSQSRLRERARGELGHEARSIRLSDDGARVAAMINEGPSALYRYNAVLLELDHPRPIRCPGDAVERIDWHHGGELLVVSGPLGYRVFNTAGARVCSDESPRGLSATCLRRGTHELYCVRRDVLGGVELASARALPTTDLSHLCPGRPNHWGARSLDAHASGLLCLAPGDAEVTVLDARTRERAVIVQLRLEGVRVVNMKVAFDASGRFLLLSATHIGGLRVTHLVYDGLRGELAGALTTSESAFGHHARVVLGRHGRRVFAADGRSILVAQLPRRRR